MNYFLFFILLSLFSIGSLANPCGDSFKDSKDSNIVDFQNYREKNQSKVSKKDSTKRAEDEDLELIDFEGFLLVDTMQELKVAKQQGNFDKMLDLADQLFKIEQGNYKVSLLDADLKINHDNINEQVRTIILKTLEDVIVSGRKGVKNIVMQLFYTGYVSPQDEKSMHLFIEGMQDNKSPSKNLLGYNNDNKPKL